MIVLPIIWTIGVTAVAIWLIAEPIAETSPLNAPMIAGSVPRIDVQALPNAVINGDELNRDVQID